MKELLRLAPSKGFDYVVKGNPTIEVNPKRIPATWLNIVTGEMFVCLDNTFDENVWIGQRGTEVPQPTPKYALYFNGASSVVNCGAPIFPIENSFTLETWFKASSFSEHGQFITCDASTAGVRSWQFRMDSSGVVTFARFTTSDVISLSSLDTYMDNQWHHAACVFDTVEGSKLYIDGDLAASHTNLAYNNSMGAVLSIGARVHATQGTLEHFKGLLRDCRIWSTAKNQEDIKNNMSLMLTGSEPGLAAYYPFSEGAGSTLVDSTGSGNNGDIIEATWFQGRLAEVWEAV